MKRLPEYLLVLYALTGTLSIAASQLAMVAGALVALFDRGRRTWLTNPRTNLVGPLLAWAAASVLATLAASDPMASAAKLRKLALFGMVFWPPAVVTRRWSIGRLSMALLFGAGITSLYGLLTFFLQGGPQLELRIRGFHGFYLTNAGLLLLCAFPALVFAGQRSLSSSSRWGAGLTAASVIGVLLFGRLPGAWLGTLAGLLYLIFIRRRRAGLVALGAAALAVLLAPEALRESVRDLSDPGSRVNQERAAIWRNGLELFARDPWTGWGLHDLRNDYATVREPGEMLQGHMHSVPVTVAASMGVPGLIALVWLMGAMFRELGRARRRLSRGFERDVVESTEAGLVAFLAAGLIEWNLGDSEILALLSFLVGLSLAASRVALGPEPAVGRNPA